jgi:hypothetical protein
MIVTCRDALSMHSVELSEQRVANKPVRWSLLKALRLLEEWANAPNRRREAQTETRSGFSSLLRLTKPRELKALLPQPWF